MSTGWRQRRPADGLDRRDEGVGHGHYRVAQPAGAINANRTASSRSPPPTQCGAAERANSFSKPSTCAAHERGGAEGLAEGVHEFFFEFAMRGDQVETEQDCSPYECSRKMNLPAPWSKTGLQLITL
jgi:hypothetical protein